jgi:hypothetical protein
VRYEPNSYILFGTHLVFNGLTLALDGIEWLALCASIFTPSEEVLSTLWIWGLVGPWSFSGCFSGLCWELHPGSLAIQPIACHYTALAKLLSCQTITYRLLDNWGLNLSTGCPAPSYSDRKVKSHFIIFIHLTWQSSAWNILGISLAGSSVNYLQPSLLSLHLFM